MLDTVITYRHVLYGSGTMIVLTLLWLAFAMWKVNRGDWG